MSKKFITLTVEKVGNIIGMVNVNDPEHQTLINNIVRMLLGSDILSSFNSFWETKIKNKEFLRRKSSHKGRIQEYILPKYYYNIEDVALALSNNIFDCQDGIHSIDDLNKSLLEYFNPEFFDSLLETKIKDSQPIEGFGEHYLWALFNNIDFSDMKGDLVNRLTGHKLEVKTNRGALGSNTSGKDWSNAWSIKLKDLLLPYIDADDIDFLTTSSSFGTHAAKAIEKAIKRGISTNDLCIIGNIVSNYDNVDPILIDEFVSIIVFDGSYKSILTAVAALHLKLYSTDEKFDKLLLFNGGESKQITKLTIISTNNTISMLYKELIDYKVQTDGWGGGKKGIRIKTE